MSSLASLPRELVYVLARFEPCAVTFFARANRSSWARFANDPLAWEALAKLAATSDEGKDVLLRHAASVLAMAPALDRVCPMPLLQIDHRSAYPGPVFAVSNDGALLACVANDHKRFRVLDTATMHERALLRFDAMIGQLLFSPSNTYIVVGGCHVGNRFWVYDCANKYKKRVLGLESFWRGFWFLPNDVLAAFSTYPSRVEFWDLQQGAGSVKALLPELVEVLAVSSKAIVICNIDILLQRLY